jgi:hypothetical protein
MATWRWRLAALLACLGAVVQPAGLPARAPRGLDPAKLGGIVVDDEQAARVGAWVKASAVKPFVGKGYLHDYNAGKGKLKARFTPKLPRAGRYEVRLLFPAGPNRASNTPVVIHHADGEKTIKVDQRKAPRDGKGVLLGTFRFKAGKVGWVEVRNEGTKGYVVADAVQWLPVK